GEYEATVTVSDGTDEVTDSVTIQVGEAPAGAPQLAVAVKPKSKTVAKRKRQVGFKVTLRNTGDAKAQSVKVCAKAKKKRLAVKGKGCRTQNIQSGGKRTVRFNFRIKRAAIGKRTKIRFVVSGGGVKKQTATATLRVKR
ncbi:MAG TPA: CARDB domain-containing protein, partial [Solirubrobacterales bacterium]